MGANIRRECRRPAALARQRAKEAKEAIIVVSCRWLLLGRLMTTSAAGEQTNRLAGEGREWSNGLGGLKLARAGSLQLAADNSGAPSGPRESLWRSAAGWPLPNPANGHPD